MFRVYRHRREAKTGDLTINKQKMCVANDRGEFEVKLYSGDLW
jgi:hypothetical protein